MHRLQRTIRRPAQVTGIGFLTGADVTIRFLPAPAEHGIVFERVDCAGSKPIPALLEYAVPRQRRTAIEREGVTIEMTEHVMAALAGLQIDNCLVQLDAPEPPGCDGSSFAFVDALLDADVVELDAARAVVCLENVTKVRSDDGRSEIVAKPLSRPVLAIGYLLDYGPRSPIPAQTLTVEVTPATFVEELAYARTFVLESEVQALRAQGYGKRTTARDLLVFAPHGVVDNQLRSTDECVRHKILDCLGDFALIGSDLVGHFSAYRSGHRLNREMIRRIKAAQAQSEESDSRRAA